MDKTEKGVGSNDPLFVAMALIFVACLGYGLMSVFGDAVWRFLGWTDDDPEHDDVKGVLTEDSGDMMNASSLTRSLLEEGGAGAGLAAVGSNNKSAVAKKSGNGGGSQRLASLDTFRGLALTLMIFVNYGGGGYWFFEHSDWNGITVADLLFPWFIFMMGVSMHLSFRSMVKRNLSAWETWKKILMRTAKLFALGLFLNNGYNTAYWRIPGVLQYFAVAYLVTASTVLGCRGWVSRGHATLKKEMNDEESGAAPRALFDGGVGADSPSWTADDGDKPSSSGCCGGIFHWLPAADRAMLCYWPEWVVQFWVVAIYLTIHLVGQGHGDCPYGYTGPGGRGDHGDHSECTGGIHRYIDEQVFGLDHIYGYPTCMRLYDCQAYDPEGALGVLTACTVTYLGLMTGRALLHYEGHWERVLRWVTAGCTLLLLAGALCEFKQDGGFIPINKNLWSTSFGFFTAGAGMVGLSLCYLFCDIWGVWTGAPLNFMGMNSILFYCAHDVFGDYFPFSISVESTSHEKLLISNIVGVGCWLIIAYYFHHTKFYWKL